MKLDVRKTWGKARFGVGLLAFLSLLLATPAHAGELAPDLTRLLAGGGQANTRVIVQTVGRPTALLLQLVGLRGGRLLATFDSIDGFVVTLPLPLAPVIAALPGVERISLDLPVGGAADLTSAATGAGAAREETGLSGAGVGVAILDTGVARHPDLVTPTQRIVGWVDLVNGKTTPYDDSGHGTHIAGIIAGNGASAGGVRDLRGIAPGANIVGVKVLDAQMKGYASTVIQGLDYCAKNKDRYNIRVVNLSMGQLIRESYRTDPLCRAVENTWKRGIVVVVSAGNLGRKVASDPESGVQYGTITCPGNDPLVITVGATRTNHSSDPSDDQMASFSSRGPTRVDQVMKPDLVAPGNKILSLAAGSIGASRGVTVGAGNYMELSGTSMAAPVVTGAVALMLQRSPSITPDTVKVRLMHSATKRWNSAEAYGPFSRGSGLLNVPDALRQTEQATARAGSPLVDRLASRGLYVVTQARALWGDRELVRGVRLWSNSALWGEAFDSSGMYAENPFGGPSPTGPGSSGPPPPPPPDNASILWGEPSAYEDEGTWSSQPPALFPSPSPSPGAPPPPPDQASILWGEPSLQDDP